MADIPLRRIVEMEAALGDLRRIIAVDPSFGGDLGPVSPVERGASFGARIDMAERMVANISASDSFDDSQRADFQNLAESSLNERLRAAARGGPEVADINITVTGTGTISI